MGQPDPEVRSSSRPEVPLRVGVLIDSMVQPAWVERALRVMTEAGIGRIVMVVRNAAPPPPAAKSRLQAWWRNRRHLLFALFQRLDRRRFRTANDPLDPVDISPLLAGAEVVDVVPRQTRAVDRFEDADVERVKGAGLDVLVRFGFRILRGDILGAARFGVWSYHHGDHQRYRGGPPAVWEVFEGNPVTGTVLQRLTEALDDGKIVYRAFTATDQYSLTRNRHATYWRGSDFLVRAMTRLAEEGDPLQATADEHRHPSAYGSRLYVSPSNRQVAAGALRIGMRRVTAKRRALFTRDQWFMAWARRPGLPDENIEPELAPYRFRLIMPPSDRFWADPFPVRADGGEFVLFEELPFASRKGVIALLELGRDGPVGAPVTVLERDYHLSYPFTFTWRGSQFMMPETTDAGRVEVFRATRFPFEWTLETVLSNEGMADCTIAQVGERWWMFATVAGPSGSYWDDLHVFHAASPLGPWTPHRRNPVVTDVRTARPAGRPFRRGDTWYRPSQDCSTCYGGALNIQQIVRLDEGSYEERTVGRVEPGWLPGLIGVHTVNALGGLTVIDALRRIPKMPGR
jgi:hypothetical protein